MRNYLPHMTRPEVEDLLTRTDMVIIPVGALEQHGTHLPIGTDHLNGVERAKRIAYRTDVLVAPILLPGQSPYHMGFAGTVTLPSTLIQEVYVEAAKSLIRHGFRRFLMLNAHGGNRAITTFIVDRINQETAGIAVDLGAVAGPLTERGQGADAGEQTAPVLDRHGGTGETSNSLYLIPELVDLDAAYPAELTMPAHLEAMVPGVLAGGSDRAIRVPGRGAEGRVDGEGHVVGRAVEHGRVGRAGSGRGDSGAREGDDGAVRGRGGALHRAVERVAAAGDGVRFSRPVVRSFDP